ncbi:MAG: hypothetical protein LBI27_06685, partial [Clostridiales bacterium]|nr:hypothetical protein [Clostridiales bacterium]
MDFQDAKRQLLDNFQNNFETNPRLNNRHATQLVVETLSNGTVFSVSYPGYKAGIGRNGNIIYDYRVDMIKNGTTTALSHTNIITDIYNKIVNGGMSADELKNVFVEISQEGTNNTQDIVNRLPYSSVAPGQALRDRVRMAHGNKTYNHVGNSFDLTVEELLTAIKLIVLQEDINYPVANGCEGRKMPFARYLETIFITQNASHTLEDVIDRALSHT